MGGKRLDLWLTTNAPAVLTGLGLVVLIFGMTLAFLASPVAGVGAVVFACLVIAFGVVMGRIKGTFKLGKEGLEAELLSRDDVERAIEAKVAALGLPETAQQALNAEALNFLAEQAGPVVVHKHASDHFSVSEDAVQAEADSKQVLSELLAEGIVSRASRDLCADCGAEMPPDHDSPRRKPCRAAAQ